MPTQTGSLYISTGGCSVRLLGHICPRPLLSPSGGGLRCGPLADPHTPPSENRSSKGLLPPASVTPSFSKGHIKPRPSPVSSPVKPQFQSKQPTTTSKPLHSSSRAQTRLCALVVRSARGWGYGGGTPVHLQNGCVTVRCPLHTIRPNLSEEGSVTVHRPRPPGARSIHFEWTQRSPSRHGACISETGKTSASRGTPPPPL